MNLRLQKRIKKEVAQWGQETNALLSACGLLVAYFGTTKEKASWNSAIAVPQGYVQSVLNALTDGISSGVELMHPPGVLRLLSCSESTARRIAPLLEIVGGPIPAFVRTIRATARPEEQRALVAPFGAFSGNFALYICEPVWQKYRHLAPKEWIQLNPRAVHAQVRDHHPKTSRSGTRKSQ